MSAVRGKADEIGPKADIGQRMSATGGQADVPAAWPGSLLLAKSRHWPRTDCRLAQSPLFGQRHLELDSRQLLGELADALQKRQPARVELDVGEQGLDCNLSQSNRWKNFDVTGGHSSN